MKWLTAILALLAAWFRGSAEKAKRKRAEDRAESAERGLENAKTAKDNRNLVESSSRRTVDRLFDKFTRKD